MVLPLLPPAPRRRRGFLRDWLEKVAVTRERLSARLGVGLFRGGGVSDSASVHSRALPDSRPAGFVPRFPAALLAGPEQGFGANPAHRRLCRCCCQPASRLSETLYASRRGRTARRWYVNSAAQEMESANCGTVILFVCPLTGLLAVGLLCVCVWVLNQYLFTGLRY